MTKVTFKKETVAFFSEAAMEGLLKRHWEEVAVNKEEFPLDPDFERYRIMEQCGVFHVVVARHKKKMVGYACWLVCPHLHYKTMSHAVSDIFYLDREYRKGWNGVRLFRASEIMLRHIGVQKVSVHYKLSLDIAPILKRLGYTPIEGVQAKLLG